MSDSDTFAFAFLCGYFKERLKKMRSKNLTLRHLAAEPSAQDGMNLQRTRPRQKLYRVINAGTVIKLARLEQFQSSKSKQTKFVPQSQFEVNQQARLIQSYQPNSSTLFDP